jgi:hypothetical protein
MILGAGFLATQAAFAQGSAVTPLAFTGHGPSETTVFTVQDRWEAHWSGVAASVTIEDASGGVLAGAGGENGTLYYPGHGSYKVRIVPNDSAGAAWKLEITQAGAPGGAVPGDAASSYVPPDMTFAAVASTSASPAPVAPGTLSTTATSAAPPPGQPPVIYAKPSGSNKLSESQTAAMVVITGDKAQGTGFLIHTPIGSFVITNQHVIGDNPHLQITTTGGDPVKFSSLAAASDRDLAMISIEDNHYTYLQLADTLTGNVQVGDALITPGNSLGGGVMLTSEGQVVAIGPEKVEFSNPVYHGNSGGPMIQSRTGKVIGVVTEGRLVVIQNAFDMASFMSNNSPIKSSVRYFGMRLDNVPAWLNVPWQRFENETTYLADFDERTKCLDSLLNSHHDDTEFGSYYRKDEQVKAALDDYKDSIARDPTADHRVEAVRTLLFSVDTLADDGLDDMKNPANFYSFDQEHAKENAEYRDYLKKEIASVSSDVSRLTDISRSF